MSDDETETITADDVEFLIAYLDSDPFHNLGAQMDEAFQQCAHEIAEGLKRFGEGMDYAVIFIKDTLERQAQ